MKQRNGDQVIDPSRSLVFPTSSVPSSWLHCHCHFIILYAVHLNHSMDVGNSPVDYENWKAKEHQCLCPQIKAFEKMDHLARAQRMLELQEAENARVSSCITTQLS